LEDGGKAHFEHLAEDGDHLIRQRIYRGVIDSPKTSFSIRQAALPEGLLREIEAWRADG
jgi:hypothetical protein